VLRVVLKGKCHCERQLQDLLFLGSVVLVTIAIVNGEAKLEIRPGIAIFTDVFTVWAGRVQVVDKIKSFWVGVGAV
jgi:hypothetical protein